MELINGGRSTPSGNRAQLRLAGRRTGQPLLRDAATICTAVLRVPGDPLRCELDAGHEDTEKHKNGCTRWA